MHEGGEVAMMRFDVIDDPRWREFAERLAAQPLAKGFALELKRAFTEPIGSIVPISPSFSFSGHGVYLRKSGRRSVPCSA